MKKFFKWAIGVVITLAVAFGVVWFVDRDVVLNMFNNETTEIVEDTVETTTEAVEEVVDSLATKVDSLVNKTE